jgi:hypothetical protein
MNLGPKAKRALVIGGLRAVSLVIASAGGAIHSESPPV